MTWTNHGYGHWSAGKREVHEIGPGLYAARLVRTHKGLTDLADSTVYGTVKEAQSAANRLAANEAWTRECATPAHDSDPYRFGARGDMGDEIPDPITEPAETLANRGLFADSGM